MSSAEIATEIVLAACFVMCATVSVSMFVAAYRNHFWRRPMRPVVWALAFVSSAWALEFFKRLLLIPSTGYPLHDALAATGWIANIVNLYLLVTTGIFFYTLVVMYPDTRRPRDITPGGTD